MFKQLRQLSIQDNYSEDLYITVDIDWAHDEVILDLAELLSKFDAHATFFATHESKAVDQLKASELFEVGIHPNFNFLLNGDFRYGNNVEEVLNYYHDFVPEAVSVRSHSLAQYSPLVDLLIQRGFSHESNILIPWHSGVELKPFKYQGSDMIRVPFCWEDDVHAEYGQEWTTEGVLSSGGLKVFDFHPIHTFLNMNDLSLYNLSRSVLHNPKVLLKNRYIGNGTRSFLIELLESKK